MKFLLTLALCALSLLSLSAQQSDPAVPARTATAELAQRYELTADQRTEVQRIQTRYYTDLAKIAPLEARDLAHYVQKRKALEEGTRASLGLLLDKDQRRAFDRDRRAQRRAKADLVRELASAGKTELEIQRALLEVK